MIKEILVYPTSDFRMHEENLKGKTWAELRLDIHHYEKIEYIHLLLLPVQWVVSFREVQHIEKLPDFLAYKPFMIDIPLNMATEELVRKIQANGTRCMLSFHSNQSIQEEDSFQILTQMRSFHADVYKLVFTARTWDDNEAIKKLYTIEPSLVAFNMGSMGKESRIYAALHGEKMIYLAPDSMTPLAPGQLHWSEWLKIKAFLHV